MDGMLILDKRKCRPTSNASGKSTSSDEHANFPPSAMMDKFDQGKALLVLPVRRKPNFSLIRSIGSRPTVLTTVEPESFLRSSTLWSTKPEMFRLHPKTLSNKLV